MSKTHLIILLVLLFVPRWALGQIEEQLLTFVTEDGLSQNAVYDILQDRDGFLWIATQDGLNRFDGETFQVYRQEESVNSLDDNFIVTLFEDPSGQIWIGTRNGLNRLDKFNNEIHRHDFEQLENSPVTSIVKLDSLSIGIPVGDDLHCFKILEDNSTSVDIHHNLNVNKLYNCNGNFYSVIDSTFVQLDSAFNIIPLAQLPEPIVINKIRKIGDNFFLMHTEGIVRIDKEYSVQKVLTELWCTDVIEYSKNEIWIATWQGIIRARTQELNGKIDLKSADFFLADIPIHVITKDRENNIWIGTLGFGLKMLPKHAQHFKILPGSGVENSILPSPLVWSILEDKSNLFIATAGGVVQCIKKPDFLSWSDYTSVSDGILESKVWLEGVNSTSLLLNGTILWVTSSGADGLYKINLSTGKVENINTLNQGYSNRLFYISKASNESFILSSVDGICLFNPVNETCEIIHLKELEYENLEENINEYVIHACEDKNGNIWASTTRGVVIFDPKTKKAKTIHQDSLINPHISFEIASHVTFDGDKVWITTLKDGLNKLDLNENSMAFFSKSEGLKNGMLYTAMKDESGGIWVSHNEGLSRLSPSTRRFDNYGLEDGLTFLEYGQNSYYEFNHTFWFGGTDGVVCFDPRRIEEKEYNNSLYIADIKINYESIGNDSLRIVGSKMFPEKIELSQGDKALTLHFGAIDFSFKDKQFQYKLEGFNEDWVTKESSEAVAQFTSLPYDDYVLKIRQKSDNGHWSDTAFSINIEVIPPWWRTWWFITLASLSIAGGLILVVIYYSQRKLKERLREIEIHQKLQKERERISMDLHDNVGSQITHVITSLDTLSYKLSASNLTAPREKIDDLSDFARDTMTQLRDTIWALNKDHISVREFINRINDHIQRILSHQEQLKYKIQHQGDLQTALKPAVTINLYRIVQESINNIVKHAEAELIFLHLEVTKDKIVLAVVDDGIGLDFDKNHEGHYGLENMKIRMKEIGGTLNIESRKGVGTSINITLPI